MFSLTYKSKAMLGLKSDEIQILLKQAREYNSENGITGCLLYYKGEFLQYMEGTDDSIMNLFRKIKEDKRHTDVSLLSYDYKMTRAFENWEMAYEDFDKPNHQLEYLKLLVSLFVENPNISLVGNPTSKRFWSVVKEFLPPESIDR